MNPQSAIWNFQSVLPLLLAAIGFFAACIGILKAGWSMGAFFRGALVSSCEFLRVQERQAAALERSADMIPALDRFHAAQEQIGTELRVMSRQMRQLKDVITGEQTDGKED